MIQIGNCLLDPLHTTLVVCTNETHVQTPNGGLALTYDSTLHFTVHVAGKTITGCQRWGSAQNAQAEWDRVRAALCTENAALSSITPTCVIDRHRLVSMQHQLGNAHVLEMQWLCQGRVFDNAVRMINAERAAQLYAAIATLS